ncbi:uncharacterized protein BX664DRAFT_50159 [Halteromyces radiatus]|uniref:uncharacterized protein n=1 Tax=Halteromyces radiatus TaxID=101107 RepID=UPI0022210B54|nr:uncharacterized protein BX664DRAFT_50159 [Halteromyces radiatus]KAI8076314.1 hypothetical protein BX664DRAFT_50159 [Halteromyces radiatus]
MFRNQMGYSQGLYNNFTVRFLTAMMDVHSDKIKWPQGESEVNAVVRGFLGVDNPRISAGQRLPGVIGSMDGKLVNINKPARSGESYRDRKNNFSMSLMAVCDHEQRFTMMQVKEKWVGLYAGHVPHLGSRTTNRIEGAHAKLKQLVTHTNASMEIVFESIDRWYLGMNQASRYYDQYDLQLNIGKNRRHRPRRKCDNVACLLQ